LIFHDFGKHQAVLKRWEFDRSDLSATSRARAEFTQALREACTPESDVLAAATIFGELVSNAIRYGEAPIEATLSDEGEPPVLRVVDRGQGFGSIPMVPSSGSAENGRGLFICSRLARLLSTHHRPDGGFEVEAYLPVQRRHRSAA
jgi:anti-sigma regulatory factor (Ser/Thr protein kinase)